MWVIRSVDVLFPLMPTTSVHSLILAGAGTNCSTLVSLYRRPVGTAVNPRGGWKQTIFGQLNQDVYRSERPLILVGDGNKIPTNLPIIILIVGTAVNPRGGWKPRFAQNLLPSLSVGTAVNPRGGWKLNQRKATPHQMQSRNGR